MTRGLTPGARVYFSRVPWQHIGSTPRHRLPVTDVPGVVVTGPEGGYCVLRVMHTHVPPLRSRLIRCQVANVRPRDEGAPIDDVLVAEQYEVR